MDIYRAFTPPSTTAVPAPTTAVPAPTTAVPAPTTAVPAPTTAVPAPPHTSAIPTPPSPPSTGFLCTNECGTCCCPGCHAINGTCYLCPAGSFSSDCSDHLQSSCRSCPSGFFCPQGAAQPYLPSSTLVVIITCVVVAHVILACIFIRTKRLKTADAKPWILVVMIFGPIAWLLWWCLHRALSHPQTPESQLNQPLLADSHASAPPLDTTHTPILKPFAPAAGAGASFAVQQHGRVVAPAVCDAASRAHQLRFVQASHAPNDDEIPEEMTDQCAAPPFPPHPRHLALQRSFISLTLLSLTRCWHSHLHSGLCVVARHELVCVTEWLARYFTMEVMLDPVMAVDGFM